MFVFFLFSTKWFLFYVTPDGHTILLFHRNSYSKLASVKTQIQTQAEVDFFQNVSEKPNFKMIDNVQNIYFFPWRQIRQIIFCNNVICLSHGYCSIILGWKNSCAWMVVCWCALFTKEMYSSIFFFFLSRTAVFL